MTEASIQRLKEEKTILLLEGKSLTCEYCNGEIVVNTFINGEETVSCGDSMCPGFKFYGTIATFGGRA